MQSLEQTETSWYRSEYGSGLHVGCIRQRKSGLAFDVLFNNHGFYLNT